MPRLMPHHVVIIVHNAQPLDWRSPLSPRYDPMPSLGAGAKLGPKRRPPGPDPRKDPPGNRANNPYGSAKPIPLAKGKPKPKPVPAAPLFKHLPHSSPVNA